VLKKYRLPLFGFRSPANVDERPLSEKVDAFFEYMIGALCRFWDIDSCDVEELTGHMAAVTATVWKFGGKAQQSFRINRTLARALNAGCSDEGEGGEGAQGAE
jgi:hypothetical protein